MVLTRLSRPTAIEYADIAVTIRAKVVGIHFGDEASNVPTVPDDRKNESPVMNCLRFVYRTACSPKYRERISASSPFLQANDVSFSVSNPTSIPFHVDLREHCVESHDTLGLTLFDD